MENLFNKFQRNLLNLDILGETEEHVQPRTSDSWPVCLQPGQEDRGQHLASNPAMVPHHYGTSKQCYHPTNWFLS